MMEPPSSAGAVHFRDILSFAVSGYSIGPGGPGVSEADLKLTFYMIQSIKRVLCATRTQNTQLVDKSLESIKINK